MNDRQLSKYRDKYAGISSVVNANIGKIEELLPRQMNAKQFVNHAMVAITNMPSLMECSPGSIMTALRNAASMGLIPDGRHGHLIPYKDTCEFVPDFKGLVQLAYQGGVSLIECHAVREKDMFEYMMGMDGYLRHQIPLDIESNDDRGKLIASWARFRMGDESGFIVMNRADVLKRKNQAKSAKSKYSPWHQWEDEMWAKTALIQLSKVMPISDKFSRAVVYSNEQDSGNIPHDRVFDQPGFEDVLPSPSKSDRLADELADGKAAPKATKKQLEKFANIDERIRECKSVEEANAIQGLVDKSDLPEDMKLSLSDTLREKVE